MFKFYAMPLVTNWKTGWSIVVFLISHSGACYGAMLMKHSQLVNCIQVYIMQIYDRDKT